MASGYASILDWRSPIFSRVRASFGSSATSFWYSRTALSYFFFSTNFWAAWSTLSRSIATGRGTPIKCSKRFDPHGKRKRRSTESGRGKQDEAVEQARGERARGEQASS